MSDRGTNGPQESADAQIERALTDALRADPLSPDAVARIRASALSEWQRATGPAAAPLRSRRGTWASIAAAAVVITLAAFWYLRPVPESAAFGMVARSDVGEVEVRFGLLRHGPLKVGDTLRVGNTLATQGPALISLYSGGTLRVAANTVMTLTGGTQVALDRGQIYVDLPPGTSAATPFRVTTRVGTIEHVGTQFEVLSNDRLVRLRVREGRVQLQNRAGAVVIEAGTELTAGLDGELLRRPIPAYGRDWLWTAALAPDYEIEGRPLLGFLEWAGRELGRAVKFSDAHAREVAERTILHGSVRGRDPLDALTTVLATTSLSYEIRDGTIWIQSGHGT